MKTTNEMLTKYRNLISKNQIKEPSKSSNKLSVYNDEEEKKKDLEKNKPILQEIKNRPSSSFTSLLQRFENKKFTNNKEIYSVETHELNKLKKNQETCSDNNQESIKKFPSKIINNECFIKGNNTSKELPSVSNKLIENISSNVETKKPSSVINHNEDTTRLTVNELIKLNEERLKDCNKKLSSNQILHNKFGFNIDEIFNGKNRETIGLTQNVSRIKNFIKLLKEEKKGKIKQEDLAHVKELIDYYEKKLETTKKRKTCSSDDKKQRNTINENRFQSNRNHQVSIIKEEDEENSLYNSKIIKSKNWNKDFDNISIHYLSTNEEIKIKTTSYPTSNLEKEFDVLKSKTIIDKNIIIHKNDKINHQMNHKRKQYFKEDYEQPLNIYQESEKYNIKNQNKEKEFTIKTDKTKIESNKDFSQKQNDNKPKTKSYEANLVNDIHIINNKPKKENYSINNVNNIVVIANIDENKKENTKQNLKDIKKKAKDCFEDIFNQNIEIKPINKNLNQNENTNKIQENKLKNCDLNEVKIVDNINKCNIDYKKNMLESLDKICVTQYNLGNNFPFDPKFQDILCINCYECVKYSEVDFHSERCVSVPYDDDNYNNKYDVNSKIYKLYQNLRKRENEVKATKDAQICLTFDHLIDYTNQIFLNNSSIEELNHSINQLNNLINSCLVNITSNLKFTLFITAKRVSQLVYIKLQDIEEIINRREDEGMVSENFNSEEEDNFISLKRELLNLERDTIKSKMELINWRKEAKSLEKMLKKPNFNNPEAVSDIVSEFLSYRDEEDLDNITNITGQTDQDLEILNDVNEIMKNKTNNEEDLRKYFLSLALNYKFKYADKIGESVNITEMYEKVISQSIPLIEWNNFIQKEMKLI